MTGAPASSPAHGIAAIPATLDVVARHCGVSRQTVSNVVNGTGRVGELTRAKVLAAIDELDYVPHRGAAGLRSGRLGRFVYVLPEGEPREENTILLDFLQHLVIAAGARGQQTLVVSAGAETTGDLDELVRSRSVDAVVLSAVVEDDARVRHLARRGVPFVCFGRTDASAPQTWVDVDNHAGAAGSTRALIEHGHREVAFVGYDSRARWDREREAGYVETMISAGLRPRSVLVEPADPTATISRMLGRADRPTGVVTGSDVLAAACYAAAGGAGLTIGRDLAVTGFDGTLAARLLTPSLATVRIPLAAIAEQIVSRLLGDVPNDVGTVVATELSAGESLCRPPESPARTIRP